MKAFSTKCDKQGLLFTAKSVKASMSSRKTIPPKIMIAMFGKVGKKRKKKKRFS
jgi:hypothetical protein